MIAWRLQAVAAASALILALAAVAYIGHLRHRAERAEGEAALAREAANTQAVQTEVVGAAADITDRAQARALAITVRAQEAEHEIRKLPGADTPLPDALRAGVRAGVLGLRDGPAASDAAGPAGGGEPAPPMPTAGR